MFSIEENNRKELEPIVTKLGTTVDKYLRGCAPGFDIRKCFNHQTKKMRLNEIAINDKTIHAFDAEIDVKIADLVQYVNKVIQYYEHCCGTMSSCEYNERGYSYIVMETYEFEQFVKNILLALKYKYGKKCIEHEFYKRFLTANNNLKNNIKYSSYIKQDEFVQTVTWFFIDEDIEYLTEKCKEVYEILDVCHNENSNNCDYDN